MTGKQKTVSLPPEFRRRLEEALAETQPLQQAGNTVHLRRRPNLQNLFTDEWADAVLDARPLQFLDVTGFRHDSPEGVLLMDEAERYAGRPALARTYRLREGAQLSPETAKLLEKLKTMENDLECSEKLALHIYCVFQRIERLEAAVFGCSDVDPARP